MDYGTLQSQFQGLLNRRDCTTSQAQTFLQQGIMRVQRELRCPAMEKSVLVTIAEPYNGLAIPSDMLELINLIPLNTDDRLDKCDITRALQLARATGSSPTNYCRQGGVWVLGPKPSIGDVIRIDYYAELAPLVNPTDTNVILQIAWDMVMYAGLVEAGIFFRDKRTQDWEGRCVQILTQLQTQADDDELSGAAAVQPAYHWPSDFDPPALHWS